MRDEEIFEIEERDLNDVQNILLKIFNNKITYDKMKEFYQICKENKNVYLYGYYIKNQIVGIIFLDVTILLSGKKAMIWNLGVLEEYRNRGIATKLINKVETIVKEQYKDIKIIRLFSGDQKKQAHKLYEHLGYNGVDFKAYCKTL